MSSTKIFAKIVEEDQKVSILFGTEKDVPDWKVQFKEWEEEGYSTFNDKIEEVGTTDNVDNLLKNINKLIKEHYDHESY